MSGFYTVGKRNGHGWFIAPGCQWINGIDCANGGLEDY